MTMRFGICTGLDNLELVASSGFDYVELSLASLSAMTDEEFTKAVRKVQASGIKVERCNLLFPKTLRVIGLEARPDAIRDYLVLAFDRMRRLGASMVVFGSGKSRSLDASQSYVEGFRELVGITRMTADIASEYGITIVIEELNRDETNMINSLVEAAALVAAVDRDNVAMLADLYHILKENEPMEHVTRVRDFKHVHIATSHGRCFPTIKEEEVASFFKALKVCGYNGTMSIEGRCEHLGEDARLALEILRSYDKELSDE